MVRTTVKLELNRFLYLVKRKFGHFSRQQVCTTTECNVHSFASVRQKMQVNLMLVFTAERTQLLNACQNGL